VEKADSLLICRRPGSSSQWIIIEFKGHRFDGPSVDQAT